MLLQPHTALAAAAANPSAPAASPCTSPAPGTPAAAPSAAAAAAAAPTACGALGAPCGLSIPAGSPCAKDPGYCQPGGFCASCAGADGCKDARALCRPLPKACGTAGVVDPKKGWDKAAATSCCPPNADKAFTSDRSEPRQPSCRGAGLTCLYYTQGPWRTNPADMYAANYAGDPTAVTFYGTCIAVALDCGQPGKACCPNPYHSAFNPLPPGFLCWGSRDYSNASYCNSATNTCVKNAPKCGTLGAPCCVTDGGSTTNYQCMGFSTPGYYCTKATDKDEAGVCSKCPQDWKTAFKKDSWEYWQCQRSRRRLLRA